MTNRQPKSNRDRIKLAMIPLLALVLIAVIFRPSGKDAANASSLVDSSPRAAKAPIRTAKSEPRHWPTANIDDLIAYSPFDLPEPPPSPEQQTPDNSADDSAAAEPESNKPKPKKITIGKLQAIYQDSHGSVAIVNSKIVRIGDLVDGCRVVEISPDGIVVEQE